MPEEDLYCVNRFIENYFEKLIKFGQTINSKDMELEVQLYMNKFNNSRSKGSIKMKFQNLEYLGYIYANELGKKL